MYFKVWFWYLLIVIVNVGLIGNCLCWRWKGRFEFDGVKVICGKNISFFECFLVIIFVFMIWWLRLIIVSLVLFRSFFFGFKFCMSIIGEYFFKNKEWGGKLEGVKEFRNFVGYMDVCEGFWILFVFK